MKTYNQLIYERRCQIYALKKTGMSQNKIAKQLTTVKRKKVFNDTMSTMTVATLFFILN